MGLSFLPTYLMENELEVNSAVGRSSVVLTSSIKAEFLAPSIPLKGGQYIVPSFRTYFYSLDFCDRHFFQPKQSFVARGREVVVAGGTAVTQILVTRLPRIIQLRSSSYPGELTLSAVLARTM